jgi:outer membrane receptor protein involved in Fe transport
VYDKGGTVSNPSIRRGQQWAQGRAGWTALAVVGCICGLHEARAAETPTDQQLQEVVVTGSLIPQTVNETANPVTVITAEDLQTRGYSSVADALQRSALATGSVQGPQFVNGFTPGANTISLFGLSPSYTKFLIDGRPIADYPALYNGTDIITDISTIPTILTERIDILPGGQSSIYGSDAIAGVVNIILKKKQDGPQVDLRYGWTSDGGGSQRRIGLSEGFTVGNFSMLIGGQYENIDPIWGFQRSMTQQYFAGNPSSPQTAERDWLAIGLFGQPNGDLYYFLDPNHCDNVTSQFGGTVAFQFRQGRGNYCGTKSAGYYTLNNGTESTQGFLNATYDLAGGAQIFTEVLASHAQTTFNTGTVLWSTADDGGPFSYYYDPKIFGPGNANGDLLSLQRIFSPEEAGNLRDQDNKNTNNSLRATLGVTGDLFTTKWKYTADFTYTENKLTEATHLAFTSAITNFFAPLFGPNLGPDPIFGSQNSYAVNYAQFYKPITPAQYASFTGYADSYSRTEDSLARGLLTNTSLFHLPGGDAGIALVVEGGRQGWSYAPDPRFLNGETYLYTATAGDGHRTRYAGTSELRLPVIDTLTVTASGRYDDYRVTDGSFDKFTYNLGLEYRPLRTLLLRGRYGTAFKAPTLSDEFQGQSGFYVTATDYYYCATHGGYAPGNAPPKDIASCPQAGLSVFGTTQGNRNLKPISAKVGDVGLVWSPLERSALSVDYLHWDINNEVFEQDSDQLLRTESACRLGTLDPTSPTCVAAISQVQRDATGHITQIETPKLNLSQEKLGVLLFSLNYTWLAGKAGSFTLEGSYSNILEHSEIRFPGDPQIDLLNSPFYSTEFKTKANLGVTWNIGKFGTTVFVERYGRSPNNVSTLQVEGFATPGAAWLNPWTITNWSAQYEVLRGLTVIGNINNVFNRSPPYDPTWTGIDNQPYNIFNYNDYGRTFFIGATYQYHR